MRKFTIRSLWIFALLAVTIQLPSRAQSLKAKPAQLATYNMIWQSQSQNSAGSMPLNAGSVGGNVWVEKGACMLYLQHTGSWDKNGEYLKTGRFRIQLAPNPFAEGATFRQELKLKEGYVELTGELPSRKKVTVNLWLEVNRPVAHIDVIADEVVSMEAAYESWRFNDVAVPQDKAPAYANGWRRSSIYDFHDYQKEIIKKADVIKPAKNEISWYHNVGNEFNVFQFALTNENLNAYENQMWDPLKNLISGGNMTCQPKLTFVSKSEGVYGATPYQSWRYQTRKSKKINLDIHLQNGKFTDPAVWETQLTKSSNEPANRSKRWKTSVDWWNEFWSRSYIFINPAKADTSNEGWVTGRNFQLFRYQLGGNTYGNMPTKFNGGNLTYDPCFYRTDSPWDPDYRRWGGFNYTPANMKMVYWEYLKNGDFEAMLPMFDVYRNALANSELRTRVHFGHDGCSFSEQYQTSGLPVASQYGFLEFGRGQAVRSPKEREGEVSNYYIKNFYHGQLEFAFMILEYYRFSGRDITVYMPFIISAVKFFDQHFQMYSRELTGKPLDENGKLSIYPSTAGERHPGKNPADAVAGLRAVTKAVLDLPSPLLADSTRSYFEGFQTRIPEQPTTIVTVGGKDYKVFVSSLDGVLTDETLFHTVWPYNLTYSGSSDWPTLLNTQEYGSLGIQAKAADGLAKIWSDFYPSLAMQTGGKMVPRESYPSPKRLTATFSQISGGNAARTGDIQAARKAVVAKLASNKNTRYPTFWWGGDWGPTTITVVHPARAFRKCLCIPLAIRLG